MDIEVAARVRLPTPDTSATWVVDALIADPLGRIFVQRRSPDRRLFPGCWAIVGGHVEPGEGLLEALAREVHEETGWQLRRIEATAAVVDWRTPDGEPRREVDLLVSVDGDLAAPDLVWDKHTGFRWVTEADLHHLDEIRPEGDTFLRDIVTAGLRLLH